MNLRCRADLALAYKAAPQKARVVTEEWCSRDVYCPGCDSDRLSASAVNTPAVDFICPKCKQPFQRKSLKAWNVKKIVDAG